MSSTEKAGVSGSTPSIGLSTNTSPVRSNATSPETSSTDPSGVSFGVKILNAFLDFLTGDFSIARQRIAEVLALLPQEFSDLVVGEGGSFGAGFGLWRWYRQVMASCRLHFSRRWWRSYRTTLGKRSTDQLLFPKRVRSKNICLWAVESCRFLCR